MKPSIVNFIYFGLGYLVLSSSIQIMSLFEQPSLTALYNASLSIVICFASIVAIFGLVKKHSWSKPTSYIVIGFQAILTIGVGIYFSLTNTEIGMAMLIPALSFGLPLLFLAFKIYTSKPLAEYISNA